MPPNLLGIQAYKMWSILRFVPICRCLVGTSFEGGFARARVELPNNSSRSFYIWTFLKTDLAQSAPVSGVAKSSIDCSGRDRRS